MDLAKKQLIPMSFQEGEIAQANNKNWYNGINTSLLGVDECTGLKGSSACCTKDAPCKEKGGDCDDDQDCEGSLVCGHNNCKEFNPDAEETYDCCIRPVQKCNGEEGTGSCCTKENPCELGGGDCDDDSECSGDLVCGYNNCRDFHPTAGPTHDCCKSGPGTSLTNNNRGIIMFLQLMEGGRNGPPGQHVQRKDRENAQNQNQKMAGLIVLDQKSRFLLAHKIISC